MDSRCIYTFFFALYRRMFFIFLCSYYVIWFTIFFTIGVGRLIYGFTYDSLHDCYTIVVIWDVLCGFHYSHLCVSYLSSNTKEWSPEFICTHRIFSVNDRSVHINGKLYWLGLEHKSVENDEVYFVLCYDTLTHVLSKEEFLVVDNGVCEAITPEDDKIGPLYRAPAGELSSCDVMNLWVSESDFVPTSNLNFFETYAKVPRQYKFVGCLGKMVICALQYSRCRDRYCQLLFLFGSYSCWGRTIESSPQGFYINIVSEYHRTLSIF